MPRDWNAGALRKVLHGEITANVPCSLFTGIIRTRNFTLRLWR